MVKIAAFFLVVLCAVISTTNANWYGKRGDKDALIGEFLSEHLGLGAVDGGAEATLRAIAEIVKAWEARREGVANVHARPLRG